MDQNRTLISIETKDMVVALVGLGFTLGAYVSFRVYNQILKNAKSKEN